MRIKKVNLLTTRDLIAELEPRGWKVYSRQTQAYGYVMYFNPDIYTGPQAAAKFRSYMKTWSVIERMRKRNKKYYRLITINAFRNSNPSKQTKSAKARS